MFIIVNTQQSRWDRVRDGEWIEERQRPSFIHYSRARAEAELLRLQSSYPLEEFRLFELAAIARPTMERCDVFIVEPVQESSMSS